MVIIILSQSSYHQVHDVRSKVQMGGRSQVRAGKSNIPLFLFETVLILSRLKRFGHSLKLFELKARENIILISQLGPSVF